MLDWTGYVALAFVGGGLVIMSHVGPLQSMIENVMVFWGAFPG